jgi:hypothetical protein
MKRKKKIETSKLILIFTDSLLTISVIATIILAFLVKDISVLEYLVGGVFSLSGLSHGFYFWKAKAENLHKFGLDDKIDSNDSNNIL